MKPGIIREFTGDPWDGVEMPAGFDPDKNSVVGEAYINAYLLEERQAIFPRVILDNKIIKKVNKSSAQCLIDEINFKNHQERRFPNWQTDILFNWEEKKKLINSLSQDTALFVDYLSPIIYDIGQLKILIKNIEKNIYSDNNIYSKFRWVLNYLIANCKWKVSGCEGGHDRQLKEELKRLKRY